MVKPVLFWQFWNIYTALKGHHGPLFMASAYIVSHGYHTGQQMQDTQTKQTRQNPVRTGTSDSHDPHFIGSLALPFAALVRYSIATCSGHKNSSTPAASLAQQLHSVTNFVLQGIKTNATSETWKTPASYWKVWSLLVLHCALDLPAFEWKAANSLNAQVWSALTSRDASHQHSRNEHPSMLATQHCEHWQWFKTADLGRAVKMHMLSLPKFFIKYYGNHKKNLVPFYSVKDNNQRSCYVLF